MVDVEGVDGIGGSGVELEDSVSDVEEAVSSVPMEALNEIGSRLCPHRWHVHSLNLWCIHTDLPSWQNTSIHSAVRVGELHGSLVS